MYAPAARSRNRNVRNSVKICEVTSIWDSRERLGTHLVGEAAFNRDAYRFVKHVNECYAIGVGKADHRVVSRGQRPSHELGTNEHVSE